MVIAIIALFHERGGERFPEIFGAEFERHFKRVKRARRVRLELG